MKKILIAAVAATMASVSMADISIKGDAYVQYSDNSIGNMGTKNSKRVNLNVTGKSGATSVVVGLRVDDQGEDTRAKEFKAHQFYITTKMGPVNVKAGDFYGTIGLGAFSKSENKTDALMLSTQVGPATIGVYTNDSSTKGHSTNVFVSSKLAGTKVKVQHNPAKGTGWTNIMAKGTFGGILVAAENHDAKDGKDVTLIHVGGKAAGIKWDVAQLKNDKIGTGFSNPTLTLKDKADGETATSIVGINRGTNNNSKFAPLGSMLIGTGARGGTSTAVANVGNFSEISGFAVSTKLAGNTVKGIFSKNTLGFGATEDKITGMELILTRPLSGGMLTANLGKFSDVNAENDAMNDTNKGVRFDVKF